MGELSFAQTAPAILQVFRVIPEARELLLEAIRSVSAQELMPAVGRHGLAAVLQHELRASAALRQAQCERGESSPYPIGLEPALSVEANHIIGNALQVKTLLLRALDALAVSQVVPVLLKGYGFSARYYPDPLFRPMSDVDLLIPRLALSAAEAALETVGHLDADAAAIAYAKEHHHHLAFQSPLGEVELHFEALAGFGSVLQGEALYARSYESTLEGRRVRYLSAEDELVYLAAHASQHLLLRLSWLYDIKLLLLKTPNIEWTKVTRLTQSVSMESAVFMALKAAKEAFAAPAPDHVLDALQPSKLKSAVFRALFSQQRLVAAPLTGKKWLQYAASPLMATGVRRTARFSLHHLQRGLRRKVAFRFPGWTPESWRG